MNDQISIKFPKGKEHILEKIRHKAKNLGVKPTPLIVKALEKEFSSEDPIEFRKELIRHYEAEITRINAEIIEIGEKTESVVIEREAIIEEHYNRFTKPKLVKIHNTGRHINLLSLLTEQMHDGWNDLHRTGLSPSQILEIEVTIFNKEEGADISLT